MTIEIPKYTFNYLLKTPREGSALESFSDHAAQQVLKFHRQLPSYQPTDLVQLSQLAQSWGVKDILVKDESMRLGLGAFKVLGGRAVRTTSDHLYAQGIDAFPSGGHSFPWRSC